MSKDFFKFRESILNEDIRKMSHSRLKFHATKNVPHGSYSRSEIEDEHERRKKTAGAEYAKAKATMSEEVELEEKAYVSSMSPELGRKGSHDVIGKDGKVVKSYPYTKDGMKAAQAHLSKMKEEVELDEVSASTLSSYVDKARADKSRQQKARTVAKNDYKKYGIPSDKERADAAHRKASQRNTGISMAKRKLGGYTKGTEPKVLAREEVELDEVSDLQKDFISSMQSKLKKRSSLRDPNAKTAREEDKLAKQLAAKAKMKKEEVELDEVSQELANRVAKKRQDQALDLRQKAVDEPDMSKSFAHSRAANKASHKAGQTYTRMSRKSLKDMMRKEEVELDEAEMSLYDKIKAARANPSPDKPVRGRGSKNRNPKTYDPRKALDKEDDRIQALAKKKLRKEEVELDEAGPKMKDDYVKTQREKDKAHADAMGRHVKSGRKKTMTSTQRSLASMRNEEVELGEADQTKRLMSPLQKIRMDKEKADRQRKMGKDPANKRLNGPGGVYKNLVKRFGEGIEVNEKAEQLDELSPNLLHRYVKKAAGNLAGNAAVAATQASSSMKKSSPDVKRKMVNRMKGIAGASGRMADKANMAEEYVNEKLKVSHGMGAWVDDFKKSDAPQFKGKSDKERRDMAVAAYLSAKRGQKEEYASDAQRKAVWASRAEKGKK